MSSACRSRATIWLEASAARSPSFAHTSSSTRGSTCAYVPTAPLIAPTLTVSRARRSRSRSRSSSNAQSATLWPKLVGSATTPCVRPAITTSRFASAIRLATREQPLEPFEQQVARVAQLQRETGVQHVRGGEPEVDPAARRSHRPGDDLHERGHVVLGDALDLGDALGVERRLRPDLARIGVGDHAEPGQRLGDEDLDLEPVPEPRLVGPDGAHLREDVPLDHGSGWTGSRPVTAGGPPRGRP